jgi:hypothetical protein
MAARRRRRSSCAGPLLAIVLLAAGLGAVLWHHDEYGPRLRELAGVEEPVPPAPAPVEPAEPEDPFAVLDAGSDEAASGATADEGVELDPNSPAGKHMADARAAAAEGAELLEEAQRRRNRRNRTKSRELSIEAREAYERSIDLSAGALEELLAEGRDEHDPLYRAIEEERGAWIGTLVALKKSTPR